jgi:hypothetical protein
MSDATRELIRELERGGELVEDGEFSIDGAQALAKLRSYQLADAHGWILLVVEAAVVGGADPIVIPCEGALVIELGPLELPGDALGQLFAWAFTRRDASADPRERARARVLQLLALACNGLLGRAPDTIVIESSGPDMGVRLRLTPALPTGTLEPHAARPGSRLRVEGLSADHELALVRKRCRLTTRDVRLGSERISRGPVGAIDADFEADSMRFVPSSTRPLRDEQGVTIGRWGRARPTHPTLHVVMQGVTIESIDLRDESFGPLEHALDSRFVAVVERELPRDISQSWVRRGPELDAIVASARRTAKVRPRRPPE